MKIPPLRDTDDELVARLDRLVAVLESKEFGSTNVTENVTINSSSTTNVSDPDDENTPTYFTTGPTRKLVESETEFTRLDFGFVARDVNVRTTDDVVLAFADPNNEGNRIKVRASESPFTIGGHSGIDSAFLWIRKASSATSTPGVEVLAYR